MGRLTDVSHRAKAVLFYPEDHADSEGKCWPGIRTIAGDLGMPRFTVKRALGELAEEGLAEKSSRWKENGSLSSNPSQVVAGPGDKTIFPLEK